MQCMHIPYGKKFWWEFILADGEIGHLMELTLAVGASHIA